MKTEIKFELECKQHYWNFPSEETARKAVEIYPQCKKGFTLKRIKVTLNSKGKVVKRIERRLK